MNELIGKQIEHYRIDALLGEGGMGAVYRAFDMNLERPVALKVMQAQLASRPEFQARFMQEARSVAKLNHPSIVTIYHFGASQDLLFMVMAFISDGSLSAHLRQLQENSQVVQLREILIFLAQVADALGYAHRQGVIHRDIKPSNVLVQRVETSEAEAGFPLRAVVTDFGLAKLLSGGLETKTDTLLGTYPYMSPESCLQQPIDGRSDIYSLGVMLYQLTTGKLPLEIRSATDAVLKHHLKTKPVPPREVSPGLPVAVENIINKTIAHSPEDRYQTGEEVASALRQAAKSLLNEDVTQFESQRTALSLQTRLTTSEPRSAPSQISYEPPSSSPNDYLVIAQKEHTPRPLPLRKTQLSIGRSADSDIVLDHPDVSRQHACLEQTPTGWQVTDFGSTNGTYIAETKLLPNIPEPLTVGKPFRIGPYFLYWKLSKSKQEPPQKIRSSLVEEASLKSASGRISVSVQPSKVEILPGSHVQVQMGLLNSGDLVDHFRLSISDFPTDWVSLSDDLAELLPGDSTTSTIDFHPPEDSSAKAGLYSTKLLVASEAVPGETLSMPIEVAIQPFERFSVELDPSQVSHGRTTRVSIHNEGNSEGNYSLSGRDPADEVQFVNTQDQIKVAPGQIATHEIQVKANRRILGTLQTLPFEIRVKSATISRPEIVPGQLKVAPLVPIWVLPLLSLLCIVPLLLRAIGWPPPLPIPTKAPTTAPIQAPIATQPPAIQPPATQPPATQPPATQPPATQPPATQPPATQPPATVLTEIDQKYMALGGAGGFLGSPVGTETAIPGGGKYRDFQGGSIYWSPATGAYEVQGDIRAHWLALGGVNFLGYPITDESPTKDGIGHYNYFQNGAIYWSPNTGAHEVQGAIYDEWKSMNWEQGALGYPTTDESPTKDGVGRYNYFQNGAIYWSPNTGAHEVQGAIYDEWKSMNWEQGNLGYPTTDESPTKDGVGRYNFFQNGAIYWSPNTGAHEVQGAIYDKWKSMNWETSCLGYPTSDEQDYSGPDNQYTRVSYFQGGSIAWGPNAGVSDNNCQ